MKPNGKVLFIVHDLYQEDNHLPLGIAYMGAVLKKQGVEVEVYSQNVFHYSNQELATHLEKNSYDLIGVGFMAARFNETIIDLCSIINQCKKDAWLVLGGHGPSPIPEYMLKRTTADVVVIGEAEETIGELLQCKVEGGELSRVKGIAFKNGEEVFVNERRKSIRKLDSIPLPEWSLFPMEKYTTCLTLFRKEEGDRILGILTSRGCVNRCNFCYRMDKGIRFRSIENVVEEMKILKKKYGVNYFHMQDELFIASKKRVFNFHDVLKKNNLTIKFVSNARVDIFDEELAYCLKECGCQFLNFGMESSDQNVLNLMNKNTTVEENIKAAVITKKTGIGLGLNFIWGNIGDTEESLKNNIKLIKEYNTYDQLRTIRPVTPYPGCDLYYEAIKRGLLAGPEDFFNKFHNSDLLLVNFTTIPDKEFYRLLLEANKELILDHFSHTSKNMKRAHTLINDFHNLYFGNKTKFRGARHYHAA
ncbi:MAG: B12-binding domain-containing radical SAM protein [Deltaproteobacteria bacterium]|nr:B12-binding domain-containing radical SAM protein [Deltaproteobacteria bacterium]